MPEIMKKKISTFIAEMERKIIAEKHMPGHNIYKGKKPSALRNMSSLQRDYLKVEKRGIFSHIYS